MNPGRRPWVWVPGLVVLASVTTVVALIGQGTVVVPSTAGPGSEPPRGLVEPALAQPGGPSGSPSPEPASLAVPAAATAVAPPPAASGGAGITAAQRATYDRAAAVHAALAGSAADGCRNARGGLLGLIREIPPADPLWGWAFDRAISCLRAPGTARLGPDFLEELAQLQPDHPKLREQLGKQAYDNGDAREAIAQLEQAVLENGTFEGWETLADARLALAAELQANGNAKGALALWQQAQDAALNALALASEPMRPFAMHTLARAELELGQFATALQWADQSLAAVAALDTRMQAVLAPELYLFAGQIYYRAGQRDTGLAYMEQGIGMAQSGRQVAELQRLRDQFLSSRS